MAQAAKKPPTWEDLDQVPEAFIGEIVDGEIVVTPRPDPPHTRLGSELGMVLGPPFRFGRGGPGGWIILDEPGVRFGADIRIPDLAGWRVERFVDPQHGPYEVVPDWICEILSPRTARSDRTKKMPLYARHRAGHLWLADPISQTLEVYRLEGERWLSIGNYPPDAVVRVEPFDAIELDLSLLFGPKRDPETE